MENKPRSKKESIRKAAIRVFSEKGFHSTSIRTLAQVSGVAVGTIYYYFDSKLDVIVYILQKEIKEREAFLKELSTNELSSCEKVEKFVKTYIEQMERDKDLAKLLLMERLDPINKLRDKFLSLEEITVESLKVIIQKGVKTGELVPCNPSITAYAILGAVESITTRIILNDDMGGKSAREKIEVELIKLVKRLLKNKKESEDQCFVNGLNSYM